MDRIALSKRLEGLSKVFVANSPYHRELKAMAEVISKVDDEKFQTILSEDFADTEDKDANLFQTTPPPRSTGEFMQDRAQRQERQKQLSNRPVTDEDLVRAFAMMVKEDPKKAQKTYDLIMGPAGTPAPTGVPTPRMEEASEDKDAFLVPNMPPPRSTGEFMQDRAQRQERQRQLSNKPVTDEALVRAFEKLVSEMNPQKKKEVEKIVMEPAQTPDFSMARNVKPMPGLTREEEMAAEASDSDVGMFWTKDASEAILNNLVRDVVGMDKSVCCDTKRKLEKNQVPDGSHNGEKAPTLKPEQTPDQKDVIDSNMVEKSRGKVQKEAGSKKGPGIPDGTGPHGGTAKCQMKKEEKEEKEAGALEEMKEQKAEKAEEKAEQLEEKAKEHAEQASKMLEKAETQEEKAEQSERDAEKSEKTEEKDDDKQANIIDGIELGPVMEDVTLDAAETAKLSKLFE